jgi:hypothetical protein
VSRQFKKHYTRDEVRALLPQIREWLRQLEDIRSRLHQHDRRLSALMEPGLDAGGDTVNAWARAMAEFRSMFFEFQRREIQIKDLDRGLLDFPTLLGGREVFLCWEKSEEDVEFWHELDTGYSGREPL